MADLSSYLHDGQSGEVWVAPTPEMLWWTRTFGSFIAPVPGRASWLAKLIGVVLVTPSAHFANLSLHFQQYLYDVFHQTTVARVAHFVCMPLINMMVLAFFAQFSWGAASSGLLAPNGALVLAALLCGWYLVQAKYNGVLLLGIVMQPVTIATYAAAVAYWDAFGLPPNEAIWYAPTAAPYNPLLWMVVLSFVQAASHAPEPKLPPRVTGTAHWMSLTQFVFGPSDARHGPLQVLSRLVRSAAQIAFGALDEFWAAWRLIPFNFLEIMWRLGYAPAMYARNKDLSRRAIEHGDPAIDFIGVGGGAVIRDPRAIR
jgi:hypothetical protein